MDDAERFLREFFGDCTDAMLAHNCVALRQMPLPFLEFRDDNGQLIASIPTARAIEVASRIAAERAQRAAMSSTREEIVDQLVEIATCDDTPTAIPIFGINISDWVGIRTPAWHTVFSYSSPEPVRIDALRGKVEMPWFCQLDPDAQRVALLLVAEAERD